ncbi:MAG TPA: hypothetical protein VKQ30_23365 [Ktedonobacterales bacterium]|nr:hypothetical protein [Ktedonobacterales bacterium]
MYANIRRYRARAGTTDVLAEAGWRLGSVLANVSGFVATVIVDDGPEAVIVVTLFEERSRLAAAELMTEQWTTLHRDALNPGATEVACGEVLAQKGL